MKTVDRVDRSFPTRLIPVSPSPNPHLHLPRDTTSTPSPCIHQRHKDARRDAMARGRITMRLGSRDGGGMRSLRNWDRGAD